MCLAQHKVWEISWCPGLMLFLHSWTTQSAGKVDVKPLYKNHTYKRHKGKPYSRTAWHSVAPEKIEHIFLTLIKLMSERSEERLANVQRHGPVTLPCPPA